MKLYEWNDPLLDPNDWAHQCAMRKEAVLTEKNKNFIRQYWKALYPKEFGDALLDDVCGTQDAYKRK